MPPNRSAATLRERVRRAAGKVLPSATKKWLYDILHPHALKAHERLAARIERHTRFRRTVRFLQIGSNDGQREDPLHNAIRRSSRWNGTFVEPAPDTFQRLRRTYGDDPRFRFVNAAVSDVPGKRLFHFIHPDAAAAAGNPRLDLVSSLDRDHVLAYAGQRHANDVVSMEVACTTLSALCEGGPSLDVLHVDAEGEDFRILRGLAELAVHPRLIVFEHINLEPGDRAALEAILYSLGYSCEEIGRDTLAVRRSRLGRMIHRHRAPGAAPGRA